MVDDPPMAGMSRRTFLRRSVAAAAAAGALGSAWPVLGRSRGADNRPPTTVYSWSDANQRGIIPMTWQPMDKTGPALFMNRPMPGAFSAPPAEIIAHGPRNVERWRGWFQHYFRRFHPAPKWIVLDDESANLNYWGLFKGVATGRARVAVFETIWRNKAAYAKLPEAVKAFEPADFASHTDRAAIIAWNRFAGKIKNDALRRVVTEPAVEVFGKAIAVSNYGDMDLDFTVYDYNGWPESGRSLMGNWSSPSCYLGGGQRYRGRAKPPIWNRFIDNLNAVRSCLNRSPHVAPWVSFPGYATVGEDIRAVRRLWVELIRHMKAAGVGTFLYWNPNPPTTSGDDALAARTFAADAGKISAGPFEAIPLDADEVRTGGKITRYTHWRESNG